MDNQISSNIDSDDTVSKGSEITLIGGEDLKESKGILYGWDESGISFGPPNVTLLSYTPWSYVKYIVTDSGNFYRGSSSGWVPLSNEEVEDIREDAKLWAYKRYSLSETHREKLSTLKTSLVEVYHGDGVYSYEKESIDKVIEMINKRISGIKFD